MSDQPDIVPYEPIHRAGLVKLWARYFGDWSALRLERLWAWQFEANPFVARRPPKILIGVIGGEVVGHVAGYPLPVRCDGRLVTPLFAANLVADESHRWLGFRLVRTLAGEPPLVANAMSPAALGLITRCGAQLVESSTERFSFQRSYAGVLTASIRHRLSRRLGRAVKVGNVRRLAWWYRPKGAPERQKLPGTLPGHDIRPIARFGADYDSVWGRFSAGIDRTVDKTALYMNWRYVDCPTCRPTRLGLYGRNGLEAVAVGLVRTGLDRFRQPCMRYGEIAELITPEPASPGAEALLRALMRALDRRRVDSIACSSLHPLARPLLQRLGFSSTSSNEFAMAVRLDGAEAPARASHGAESWYYTAGDGDSLYCSGL